MTATESWIRRFHPSPAARVRLVCLPYAGGSAVYYYPVSRALAPSVEVLAVQYPGRQDRLAEPGIDDAGELAGQIAAALRPLLDRPVALFGHSMGAVLGFEVARLLERDGIVPVRLFASGRRAPATFRDERVHLLGDAGILAELRTLDGTASGVLDDEEIVSMALPALRSDYRAIERYRAEPGAMISAPITALAGDRDPRASIDEVQAWQRHTSAAFELLTFPGGHFFLTEHAARIIPLIADRLVGTAARE